jgi:glycosyltransferase involved in cell wall biosynthesis
MMNTLQKTHPGQSRVLFLSGEMELGGAAMFVMNVCEGLAETGGRWRGMAGVFSNLGEIGIQMRNRDLPVAGPFTSCLIHEEFIEALHDECQRSKPAAVVANLGGEAFDFLRFVPESVLRVAVIHSDDECVYRQVERYLPWIDLVVGVSAHNCEVMRKRLGKSKVPVKQVACGVPMPKLVIREIRKIGPLRILYLGRVAEQQKRASLMARVIQQSLDSGLDLTWTIAGDGPELPKLREELTQNGNKVRFLGAVPYFEVPNLLMEHDVYFLCSDFEGLPLSMLEAMGAGCVPVVSDLPSGISEVVNDANGIRVPISGPDGYVAALTELCQDRGRLAAMAAAAAQKVREEYSTVAMARRWNQVLEEFARPTEPDWSKPCSADAPPECRARWYFHPKLRAVRRILKICTRQLLRPTES